LRWFGGLRLRSCLRWLGSLWLRSGGNWNWNWIDDGASIFLVYSDVIYNHSGRSPLLSSCGGQRVGVSSKKVSSNGNIDQKEEGLIKWLTNVRVWVVSLSREEVSLEILS